MWSGSQARDGTQAPCIGSLESQPLDHQGSTHVFMNCSFLIVCDSSVGKESACNTGDPGLSPRLGRFAGEGIGNPLQYSWACGSAGKNPPAMQETWILSLGWEDPLEKGKATHSRILAWRIPWPIQSMGSLRVGHDWTTFTQSYKHSYKYTKGNLESDKQSQGVTQSWAGLSDFHCHFHGSFLPGLLKNLHTVLHSGCLHSHQQSRVTFMFVF